MRGKDYCRMIDYDNRRIRIESEGIGRQLKNMTIYEYER